MSGRTADERVDIDRKTCRSICDAIGERLQERLPPEGHLPSHLQHLVDEFRKHDRNDLPHS